MEYEILDGLEDEMVPIADILKSDKLMSYFMLYRYRGLIDDCKTEFERQKVYREFYKEIESQIAENKAKGAQFTVDIIDWWPLFTPIENYTYCTIKALGLPGFFPQYPVLNYFLDFGNPYEKIGIEADGKGYHITANDRMRDQRIYRETGWKIYRVTGSEAWKVLETPDMAADEYKYEEWHNYIMTTVEGVIRALRTVYFHPYDPETEIEREINMLYYRTLDEHRLADFDI